MKKKLMKQNLVMKVVTRIDFFVSTCVVAIFVAMVVDSDQHSVDSLCKTALRILLENPNPLENLSERAASENS